MKEGNLDGIDVEKEEVPEEAGPVRENQLGRPHILIFDPLRAGKSIYVSSVPRDPREVVEITLDQLSLVVGPNRMLDPFERFHSLPLWNVK
jgi:hypothetical protein